MARIIYLHAYFSDPKGSLGLRSWHLAKRLAKKHEVTVVCAHYPRSNVSKAVANNQTPFQIEQLPLNLHPDHGAFRRWLSFLRFASLAWKKLKNRDYDLIFTTSTPLSAWIPGYLAARQGKRWICEERDLWPEIPHALGRLPKFLTRLIIAAKKRMLRRAESAVVLNPEVKAVYKKNYGYPAECTILVPNFNSVSVSHQAPMWKGEEPLRLVYMGALGPANGLQYWLPVLAEATQSLPVEIHVYGSGSQAEIIHQKFSSRQVHIHRAIASQKISETLAAQHIGLVGFAPNASLQRTVSPNKLFDYLACGLPVLSLIDNPLTRHICEQKLGWEMNVDRVALRKLFERFFAEKTLGTDPIKLPQGWTRQERLDQLEDVFGRLRPPSFLRQSAEKT